MLEIKDLEVAVEGKKILRGINLHIKKGQIHAIMGPNGSGKSTLAKVLAGHPGYEVTNGEVLFEGKELLSLDPEERAHLGLFMGFQYPVEIPGVTNLQFLHAAYNAKCKALEKQEMPLEEFTSYYNEKAKLVEAKDEFKTRFVNDGFSGGEKKKNEIMQMAVLDPKLAVLDETDSGLDIDALKVISRGVNALMDNTKALLLITHYQRLLNYIKPHFVHICCEGKIVQTGGAELALQLEERGYEMFVEKV